MNTNKNKNENRMEGDAESTRKRALSYLRARSDSPAETESALAEQCRACQDARDRLGAELLGEYIDPETSANDRRRPALSALRERVAVDGGIRYVIVASLDRLARNKNFEIELLGEFMDHGATLIAADQIDQDGQPVPYHNALENTGCSLGASRTNATT